jgi:eukaryotic-like serine/threonine-protein kinase
MQLAEGGSRSYSRSRGLGGGSYGEVFVVYDEDYQAFAAKQFDWSDDDTVPIETFRELGALSALAHPNVVRVCDVVVNWKGYIMQVMPLYPGGSLAGALKCGRLPDYWCRRLIIEDVLRGINHVHTAGIMHRDIKADNVVLDESERGVIVDFSFARALPERSSESAPPSESESAPLSGPASTNGSRRGARWNLTSRIGTPGYTAPEVLAPGSHYDEGCDLWSTGVVAMETIRNTLFEHQKDRVALRFLRGERRKLSRREPMSKVIKALLSEDSDERPRASTALALLGAKCQAEVPREPRPREMSMDPLDEHQARLEDWLEHDDDVASALDVLSRVLLPRMAPSDPSAPTDHLLLLACKVAGLDVACSDVDVDPVAQRDFEISALRASGWGLLVP